MGLLPTPCAQPHVPGEGPTARPLHMWSKPHHRGRSMAGRPGAVGQAGWAAQHPWDRVAWLSLAAAVAAVETKEQVRGPSQRSHNKHLHWGGLGPGGLLWGKH